MRNPRQIIPLLALLAIGLMGAGCAEDAALTAPAVVAKDAVAAEGGDIVDIAVAEGFDTLVAAVETAGLVDALRGEGPLTVFAPTEGAFADLPDGFVEDLLAPRNREKLNELLLYHVVAGAVTSDDIRWWHFEQTLQGQWVWLRKTWGGEVKVNRATVVAGDVMASNGVIHAIDRVLVPRGFELVPAEDEPTGDIVETAMAAGTFTTLLTAADAADLVGALRAEGPLTVFAPTDEAFANLPAGLVAALLLPENRDALQELLLYHVVGDEVYSGDLGFYQRVATLAGPDVTVIKWFGNVWVNTSRVTTADVRATNGVIHVINRVLVPRDFTLTVDGAVWTADRIDERLTRVTGDELPPSRAQMEAAMEQAIR